MDPDEKRERIEMAMDELNAAIDVLTGDALKTERASVEACRDALKAALATLYPDDKLA